MLLKFSVQQEYLSTTSLPEPPFASNGKAVKENQKVTTLCAELLENQSKVARVTQAYYSRPG